MLSSIPIYGVLPNRDINDIKFYDSLRWVGANLQFMTREGDKSKKFLISSTIDGEGKTTITAGLGRVIAETDKRVLLIDFDLRNPKLHRAFNISMGLG